MIGKRREHGTGLPQSITPARKLKIFARRTNTESENENDGIPTEVEAEIKHKKKHRTVLISLSGVIAVSAAVCIVPIFVLTAQTTVEVGMTADMSKLDSGLGALICTEHDDAESVDTSEPGVRKAECIFYGFVRKNMTVSVVDTTAPALEVRDLVIGAGDVITADDFVVSVEDMTDVRITYAGDEPLTDKAGEYNVRIAAEDEGGNVTGQTAVLTVEPEKTAVHIEYGTPLEDAAEICRNETGADIGDRPDISECGEYRIIVPDGEKRRLLTVKVSDTTAPTATALSFDIVLGEELLIDDILTDVRDASDVTVLIDGDPDFSAAGDFEVNIDLTDEWGNSTRVKVPVRVHDIVTEVTAEAGTSENDIIKMFFGEDPEKEKLRIISRIGECTSETGGHILEAEGEYSSIQLKLTVEDTTAPTLEVHNAVVFVGQTVTPEMFVTKITDATAVTLSFADKPRTDKPGDRLAAIVAEDEAGNITKKEARLSVQTDDEPPVIYGVSTIYINIGENALYGSGVYAVDNADGMTEVIFDASDVDTSSVGTYIVKYKSTDKSGNTAEISGTVIVNAITQETIDGLADGVLSGIISPGMSQREKAWAIYLWCTGNIKYSTRTSYLMGKFIDSAYSGFKTRMGNCYVYYSVASALLTRSGIENIEIRCSSVTNPHYWNLVKIDGSWYHFDTCPHYAEYPIVSFLLTDAEMRDYSENRSIGYYDFDASLYPPTP